MDLLAQASAGHHEAFGLLFQRHRDAVYNLCFRRLGSWHEAEDAVSVVFLEAWRRRPKMVPVGSSLRPWLLGVAANVCRNVSRAARRYDAAVYRISRSSPEPDPADDVAARIDDERQMQPVLKELSRLSGDEQDVIALVVMAGLTYAEAAVALSVPIGTIRSRMSRARRRLTRVSNSPSLQVSQIPTVESHLEGVHENG